MDNYISPKMCLHAVADPGSACPAMVPSSSLAMDFGPLQRRNKHQILGYILNFPPSRMSVDPQHDVLNAWICHCLHEPIYHRCRLWGGSPGKCPPIIEKCPCIYHFLPPFALQIFWFAHQIFLTSLCQCHL